VRRRAERCYWRQTLGWWVLALGGCATISTPATQISTSRARFETASITYRTDPVAAPVAPAPAASGVQLASFVQPVPKPATAKSLTTLLQIQYPHPAGRAGLARVELILGTATPQPASGWSAQLRRALRDTMPGIGNAEGIAEAWALDVPAGEIDRILAQLEEQGYFTAGADEPATGAALTAKIDGNAFQRPWHRCEALEALSQRVRREGMLVSHPQPLEPAAAPATLAAFSAVSGVSPAAWVPERLPPVWQVDAR